MSIVATKDSAMNKENITIHKTEAEQEEIALAIGFFDGLHLGHQTLLKEVLAYKEYTPAILTFSRNFKAGVLHQKEELILTEEEKDELLTSFGIQKEFVLPFDEETMHTSKEDFISFLTKLNPKVIVVGDDFRFASKASGKAEDLRVLESLGIKIIIKDLLQMKEQKISSSSIKELLKVHNLEEANQNLGYPFFLQEKVIHGLHNGHKIGFPTANMNYPVNKVILPNGVYKTRVEIDGKLYCGMTNIGNHPTIDALENNIIETNVLNFTGDLYRKIIKVSFLRYIREQRKFSSLKELREQLLKDIKEIDDGTI